MFVTYLSTKCLCFLYVFKQYSYISLHISIGSKDHLFSLSLQFAHLCVNVFQDLLYIFVLADKFHGSFGSNAADGITVVTAKQDAQVYKLITSTIQPFLYQGYSIFKGYQGVWILLLMHTKAVLQSYTSPLIHFDFISVWITKNQYLLALFYT